LEGLVSTSGAAATSICCVARPSCNCVSSCDVIWFYFTLLINATNPARSKWIVYVPGQVLE
jgi:hypothetical protein